MEDNKMFISLPRIADATPYEKFTPDTLKNVKMYGVKCLEAKGVYKICKVDPKVYAACKDFEHVYIRVKDLEIPVAKYVGMLYNKYPHADAVTRKKVYGLIYQTVHELGEINKAKTYGSCAYKDMQAEDKTLKAFYAQNRVIVDQAMKLDKALIQDERFCKAYGVLPAKNGVLYSFGINVKEDLIPVTTHHRCYAEALDNVARYGVSGLEEYNLKDPALTCVECKEVYTKERRMFVQVKPQHVYCEKNPYYKPISVLKEAAAVFDYDTNKFTSFVEDEEEVKAILIRAKALAVAQQDYRKGDPIVFSSKLLRKAKDELCTHYNGSKSNYVEQYGYYDEPKYTTADYAEAAADGKHMFIEAMCKTTQPKYLTVLECKLINLQAAYLRLYDLEEKDQYGDCIESRYDFRPAPTTKEELEDYMRTEFGTCKHDEVLYACRYEYGCATTDHYDDYESVADEYYDDGEEAVYEDDEDYDSYYDEDVE